MMARTTRVLRHIGVATAALACVFCRGTGRLAEYDFNGRTLAARSLVPPQPVVFTGGWFLGGRGGPVQNIVRVGAQVVKEVEASKIRARLDSAAARVDLADRLAARANERAAVHLGAEPAPNERDADFVVDVLVREYGLSADNWDGAAHFYVNARLALLDGRTGQTIWDTDVTARDRIVPVGIAPGAIHDVVTARALAGQSVDEIARTLERLADYSADRITERLRSALEKVRSDAPR